MSYSFDKYKYFTYNDKTTGATCVSAISTYAGKKVRGVAKCDPRDNFDQEKGKQLAAMRCNLKVAERREKRAARKVAEAFAQMQAAQNYYTRMMEYHNDAIADVKNANTELENYVL